MHNKYIYETPEKALDAATGNIPEILYKFRDWENPFHRKTISDFELFMSSPSGFNDPFDCHLSLKFNDLSEQEITELYSYVLRNKFPEISNKKIDLAAKILYENKFVENKNDLHKMSLNYLENTFHQSIGIISFSETRDNILLWSHYANQHKGFCIGFDTNILFNTISGALFSVRYSREYPNIKPYTSFWKKATDEVLDFTFEILSTKSDVWSYEREYRMIKHGLANTSISIPKEAYKQIIIGCRFNSKEIDSFIENVRNKLPFTEILICNCHPEKFELEFSTII